MNLAPNGKPSNLNAEQYKLVRTSAFKNWFGDWENSPEKASKVVDENGEPLVVYHGTYVENPFYIFDFDKADLGFHFGTYEQAKNRSETKLFFKGSKSNINSFFLNIKSLYQVTDIGDWEYPQRYLDMFMSDNIISENEFKKNGFQFLNYKEDNKKIRNFLIKKYKDKIGFEYQNKYEGKGKSYIVIQPNQIKLADGSNTTFDSSNNDIRFKEGGLIAPNGQVSNLTPVQYELVRTKAFKKWFGDWENDSANASRVVDENGEPLVVYHFTDKKFNTFQLKGLSNGFFFTEYKRDDEFSYTNKPKAYFLNIKRMSEVSEVGDKYWSTPSFENEFISISKKGDSDGIQFIREKDNKRIIVAYYPNQIKLADGKNTTFDGSNDDIRYEQGGNLTNWNYSIGGL